MNKLNPKIKVKNSQKLFEGKYEYKTVIICPGGHWFRGKNFSYAQEMLDEWAAGKLGKYQWLKLRTRDDYEYCLKVLDFFKKLSDFHLRIEQPLLSFYTNSLDDAVKLANIDPQRTKYLVKPPENIKITTGVIVLKRIDFLYRITLSKTNQCYKNFVDWSETSNKIRLTKNCKKELLRENSWGGSYFYVKDEHALTMVKLFIGSDIARIDKVIKADK